VVNLRGGFTKPSIVVNVNKVAGYADLTWSDAGGLVIRPGTTINDILESPVVRQSFRCWWRAHVTWPHIRSATGRQ